MGVASATPACQAPLSMGFPRQEYWSGLTFPPPGDLPDSEMEPSVCRSACRFFTTEPPGKPSYAVQLSKKKKREKKEKYLNVKMHFHSLEGWLPNSFLVIVSGWFPRDGGRRVLHFCCRPISIVWYFHIKHMPLLLFKKMRTFFNKHHIMKNIYNISETKG